MILYSRRVHRHPRATRRAVLAACAGTGVALVAGCGSDRTGGPAPGPGADPTEPAVDADSDLVAEVAAELEAAVAAATATARQHRALRPLARRLASLHRSHLAELGRDGSVRPATAPPGPQAAARERLLRTEARLQRRLTAAAVEAESGALAQVLAAMAAAVAQQRAVAA
ncbi:hypothetical protein [Nocardioides sp. TF02-7]|uniref:hypothetical protein n=1 Tax=Nocardioides sp. TF02-7 TaxID=2917724 RepID=UPI001F05AACF|nr:hypothetical protein [Nocardioides sp. TF02-7]UMG92020.1 hypothetical protein MF408_18835 [Nocardioides sp. TF02-7]